MILSYLPPRLLPDRAAPALHLLPAPEPAMPPPHDPALAEAIKALTETVRTSAASTQAQLGQVLAGQAQLNEKSGAQAVELGKLLAWKEQQTQLRIEERLRAQENAGAENAVRFTLLGALGGILSAAGVTALLRHLVP